MKPHGAMCTTFALAVHLLVVPGLGPEHGCCGQCWNYRGFYWSPIILCCITLRSSVSCSCGSSILHVFKGTAALISRGAGLIDIPTNSVKAFVKLRIKQSSQTFQLHPAALSSCTFTALS